MRLSRADVSPGRGVLVYMSVGGGSMQERTAHQAQRHDEAYHSSIQQAAASGPATTADQLAKLADLRDRRIISDEEFEREKAKVLAT